MILMSITAGTMLRQGMLCPLDVISHLVALQADPDTEIRDEALRILQLEDQKHGTFLENRLLEGIELSFILQLKLLGASMPAIDNVSIFSSLFSSCVQSRRRRVDIILSLMKRCLQIIDFLQQDTDSMMAVHKIDGQRRSSSSLSASLSTIALSGFVHELSRHGLLPIDADPWHLTQSLLGLVLFLTRSLATLPFEYADEPLHIVYFLNRNLPILSCTVVTKTYASLLTSHSSLSGTSEHLLVTSTEACRNEFKQGSSGSPSSFSTKLRESLMKMATLRAVEAMLRLKAYFKQVYDLSEDKCSTFRPDDKASNERVSPNPALSFQPSPEEAKADLAQIEQVSQRGEDGLAAAIALIVHDYNRVHALVDNGADSITFVASSGPKKRRKRSASGPPEGKKKIPVQDKRKKKRSLNDDEDGDEEVEELTE